MDNPIFPGVYLVLDSEKRANVVRVFRAGGDTWSMLVNSDTALKGIPEGQLIPIQQWRDSVPIMEDEA